MNKHKNKNKKSKPVGQNLGVVTELPDTMPREVASSMLMTPGVRLTNRMRKNCHEARIETVLCSTLEPKTLPVFLARHLRTATAAQLAKWAKRTVIRKKRIVKKTAHALAALKALGANPSKMHHTVLTLTLSSLGQQAASADIFMGALATEASNRLSKPV